MAVRSERRELFDPRVLAVVNPWHTYGPIQGPAPLMHYTQKYCEYLPPTVGVPQTGWAGPGVRQGTNASVFRNELIFQRDLTIKSLLIGYFTGSPDAKFVLCRGGTVQEIDLADAGQVRNVRRPAGRLVRLLQPEAVQQQSVLQPRGAVPHREPRSAHVLLR